jgi:hypothetical protein
MTDLLVRISPFLDSLKPDWALLRPALPERLRSYRMADFRFDLLAAATVAMVSIPQAVGFALIAGLPPAMVLSCVIVGGFAAAWFFSSRHIVFGPSSSLSMVLAATFAAHRGSALGTAEMAVLMAVMIAAVQIIAGCFHLGQITQFIYRSVILGYPWTVVRVEHRQAYMSALENASVRHDIRDFTRFITAEMAASAEFKGPKI